jgi:hypothetical protein
MFWNIKTINYDMWCVTIEGDKKEWWFEPSGLEPWAQNNLYNIWHGTQWFLGIISTWHFQIYKIYIKMLLYSLQHVLCGMLKHQSRYQIIDFCLYWNVLYWFNIKELVEYNSHLVLLMTSTCIVWLTPTNSEFRLLFSDSSNVSHYT